MRRKRMRGMRRMVRLLSMAAVAASLAKELRKPKDQRTWHGEVFGFVPYDFRLPTLQRVKDSVWNPRNEHVLVGRPLGVGWSVNFYQVWRKLAHSGAY